MREEGEVGKSVAAKAAIIDAAHNDLRLLLSIIPPLSWL
jgi:hypothetical protein